MPFDQENFSAPPVQAFAPVGDEVLKALIDLRAYHHNPANWCNTGAYGIDGSACIAVALARIAPWPTCKGVFPYLYAALPPEVENNATSDGVINFNERMGTTHVELMAFYDRAIAARKAELAR